MEQLDFDHEPEQCVEHINRFFKKFTKYDMKNMLVHNPITSKTQMIIANAVHFKGQWVI